MQTAWRIARSAWEKEQKATDLLEAVQDEVSPATKKYLEEGVAYAARYADETAVTFGLIVDATRRAQDAETRAIPA